MVCDSPKAPISTPYSEVISNPLAGQILPDSVSETLHFHEFNPLADVFSLPTNSINPYVDCCEPKNLNLSADYSFLGVGSCIGDMHKIESESCESNIYNVSASAEPP